MAIVDEIGVVDRRVYEVVMAAMWKRDTSLVLMIGTPSPDGTDSVMWEQIAHGREHPEDTSFRLVEYGAPAECDLDDEDAWEIANPALGDVLHRDAMRALLPPKLRESTYRRARLGQWVDAVEEPWIQPELWATCEDGRPIDLGADVVVALTARLPCGRQDRQPRYTPREGTQALAPAYRPRRRRGHGARQGPAPCAAASGRDLRPRGLAEEAHQRATRTNLSESSLASRTAHEG